MRIGRYAPGVYYYYYYYYRIFFAKVLQYILEVAIAKCEKASQKHEDDRKTAIANNWRSHWL
mgnify:CR=1 FL=1